MNSRVMEIRKKAEKTLKIVERMIESEVSDDVSDLQAERRILIEIIEDFEYIQTGRKKERIN